MLAESIKSEIPAYSRVVSWKLEPLWPVAMEICASQARSQELATSRQIDR